MKRIIYLLTTLLLLAGILAGCATPAPTATPAPPTAVPPTAVPPTAVPTAAPPTAVPTAAPPQKLLLATTTSTQDSGLLSVILPDFEKQFNAQVEVVAVGTGQAIKLGQDGNADVLLVHARAQEDAFMAAGDGVRREDVMYNDFIIVGPPSDPAGIKGMKSAANSFKKLAETKSKFVSRGDNSGTHTKEKAVWASATITPTGSWYISAGQGMGEVLTMANEQNAYTLSDRATYLARTKQGIDLAVMVEGDKVLLNPYGVIAVNPNKSDKINAALANDFIDWIISVPTQEKIAAFGKADFGQSLFYPDSAPWRAAHPAPTTAPATGGASAGGAGLKVTGMVGQESSWTEAEVKALPTVQVESTNKQGQVETYTGVLVSELLAAAGGAKAGATKIVLVADDGYTAEAPLTDVQACAKCILSFRSNGGFSAVFPGMSGALQVKGVIEIKVQ